MIIEDCEFLKIKFDAEKKKEEEKENKKVEQRREISYPRKIYNSKSEDKNSDGDLKLYLLVSILFLFGYLAGVICFKNEIALENIQEQILSCDFFGWENVIDKETILLNLILEKVFKILVLWIIGASVIGAPCLMIWCMCEGASLACIVSGILFKYGVKEGYVLLFKNLFLPYLFTDFVIVLLTASSIKLTYRILWKREELRNELIRHSVLSIIAILMLFTAIGIQYGTILNNFT